MRKNITYLFGAGASANALPIVKYFNPRLELFAKYLEGFPNNFKKIGEFISEVRTILDESRHHSTIDTVAKKYFHSYDKNLKNLERLKKVLTVFFYYEQMRTNLFIKDQTRTDNYSKFAFLQTDYDYEIEEINSFVKNKKSNIDYRYDSFIASLLSPLENNFILPENINILTWNYDCQFEMALKQFKGERMYNLQKDLGVYPFMNSIEESEHWKEINKQKFKILHLNGQAQFYWKETDNGISQYKSMFDLGDLHHNIESVINFADGSGITFSWEKNSKNNLQSVGMSSIIEAAKKVITNTNILVIIGYSFPFFNRIVDKELFFNKHYDKIYIQDIYGNNIRDLFINVFHSGNDPQNIIVYNDINQFLIPPELD